MTIQARNRSHLSALLLICGGTALGAQALTTSAAAADTVSIQVGGSAGVHVNVDGFIDAIGQLEAGLSFGIGFSDPPPPPPPVPTYYVEYSEPVYAPPPQEQYYEEQYYQESHYQESYQNVVQVAPAPKPALARWGLGAFAGSVQVDDQEAGADLGLVGRYRFSRSWSVEGEVAKTQTSSGERTDKRVGGALVWHLPILQSLKPSLLVGAGYGQSEFGKGEFHARQGYGEVGLGVAYALSNSLHLTADVRTGTRSRTDDVTHVALGSMADAPIEEDEDYSRARVGAMIFF